MRSLWTLALSGVLGTLGPYWLWRPPVPLFPTIAIVMCGLSIGILYLDHWTDEAP